MDREVVAQGGAGAGDADAYSLSTAEVAVRAWEAHVAGATEVCMQGGIDPELPVTGYAERVKLSHEAFGVNRPRLLPLTPVTASPAAV